MINLVSPELRVATLREYWTRVVSVWGFLFAIVLVAFVALIAPTYVLYSAQYRAAGTDVRNMHDSEAGFAAAESAVKDANTLSNQLLRKTSVGNISDVVAAIKNAAGSDIRIESLTVARSDAAISSIAVKGIATSRSSLADYAAALERSPFLEKAVVPVGDLARESDLPFAITVAPSASLSP